MIRRFHPLLLALIPLVVASCSKDADNSTLGPGFDDRGVALGAANLFAPQRALVWSAATNELVGVAGSAAGVGSEALIAMSASSGAIRLLDAAPTGSLRLSEDGGFVYYESFVSDTGVAGDRVELRRRPLGAGASQLVATCSGVCAHLFAISDDESRVAWSRLDSEFDPESLRIVSQPSGALESPGAGLPVAFAPDASALLYQTSSVASALQQWLASSGAGSPFDLGLPLGAAVASLDWSDQGVQVLYLQGAHELWLRNATAATTRRVLLAPGDSLLSAPIAWSRDGRKAALWALEQLEQQQQTVARLYVVDLVGTNSRVVASGLTSQGAVAFSPDGSRIAQLFGGQLYTSELGASVRSQVARSR
ncbi:MAG: hypothetical protein HOP12_11505 [Candidatus Eisenbacteria bacterium]|uniref:WD40 repeat domain-containing protein n=1 Tax=Eiseniibacteriota bacterium TaxID=2212470 RepID=A0A849SHC5_UNCEI|nr:hypothetical protein [Candidatus Eisenbacteria bacterium]